jgi:hypothetical protein
MNTLGKIAVGALAVIAVLALVAACFLLGGVIIWAAWNLGVVPLVAACGGTVAKIGFWTAVFVSVALNVVGGIFRRNQVTTAS